MHGCSEGQLCCHQHNLCDSYLGSKRHEIMRSLHILGWIQVKSPSLPLSLEMKVQARNSATVSVEYTTLLLGHKSKVHPMHTHLFVCAAMYHLKMHANIYR